MKALRSVFVAGAITSAHGLRHIALAALVGMISPFFIITAIEL